MLSTFDIFENIYIFVDIFENIYLSVLLHWSNSYSKST